MAKVISSLPGSTGVLSKTSQLINDGETGISTYIEVGDNVSELINDSGYITISDVTNTPDATTTVKGKLKLAGDLSGTADIPTVPGLVNKVDKVSGKSLIADAEITRLSTVVNQDISNKVDKVAGKQLSDENYTLTEKNKLVSLSNFDPTTINNSLANKVDKEVGKSLISNTEITRLGTLANYTHPVNHPPSIITQDSSNRFVTDAEKSTWNGKQNALGYAAENVANKNTANGYAGLGADGKLISSQLPNITISDTFVTTSQAAMLALTAQTGDVSIRTDLNKSFILKINDPTVLANWQELLTPTSAVTTVFGRNGGVTAQTNDYNADQITETATRKFQTANQNTFNDATSSIQTQLNGKQPTITAGTTSQYYRGDKTFQPLNSTAVGLGDVNNTSDVNKPVSTATQTALNLKANLASPTFTGTPTAPTATAGTNTTQIATTAFVNGAISTADSGNVKTTGAQTIVGKKTFNTVSTDRAIDVNNSNTGEGIRILNSAGGYGQTVFNTSTGEGVRIGNTSNGIGLHVQNQSGGAGIVSKGTTASTGFVFSGGLESSNTFTVNKFGATTATSFIKSSTPTTNILLAGGGDIAQNTAFNKNFGTTAGTVVEGGTLGSNAYSSTAFAPLNGTGASGTWGINISGNANTATGWNGYDGTQNTSTIAFGMGYDTSNNKWGYSTADNYKSWLGLGSNAYTSTAYLPLSGGDVSGNVRVLRSFVTPTGGIDSNIGMLSSNTSGFSGIGILASNTSSSFIHFGDTDNSDEGQIEFYHGDNSMNFRISGTLPMSITSSGVNLTGTVTAPTAAAGTNTTQIATTAFVLANGGRPYKVYTALLSQSGTNAPVATVLENTLGGSINWIRNIQGHYLGSFHISQDTLKTVVMTTGNSAGYVMSGSISPSGAAIAVDTLLLSTGMLTDGLMSRANLEIRVYN